jgi:hypothetical protein
MRAIVAFVFLAAACSGAQQAATADAQPPAGSKTPPASPVPPGVPPPGTNPPPAVPPNDPPNPDAGPVASAPADAGPGTIADVPCATPPQVVWTRSFPDSSLIDFRGTADAQGNLYWIEYARPPFDSDQNPPATLVSVDSSGNERYRAPFAALDSQSQGVGGGNLLVSSDTLVTLNHATVTGYDTATGAQKWSVDLSDDLSFDGGNSTWPAGLVDLGTGRVAAALNDTTFGGVYVFDSATGSQIARHVADISPGFRMLASDGAGHAIFSANQTFFDADPNGLSTADVYSMDDSGSFQWIELVERFEGVLLWTPGTLPWLSIDNSPDFDDTSTAGPLYLSAPREWSTATAVLGGAVVFDDFSGFHPKNGQFPLQIDFVRDGAIVSSGVFSEISTFNGDFAFNLGGGDHAAFVVEQVNAQAGLCHPETAGPAYLGRVDETSAQLCKLPITGDSGIVAVAPSGQNVVLGRYVASTEACDSSEVDPFVIEAYARP